MEITKEKTGKIIFVAKTNGIKMDDQPGIWYNPIAGFKIDMKQYINKRVTLTLKEGNNFSDVKIADISAIEPPKAPTTSQSDFWQRKELREIENSKRIAKHGALNTAIEILKANRVETFDFKTLTNMANDILKWVNE